ncbi:hypothetical protein D3C87_1822630 [compost metagenome]
MDGEAEILKDRVQILPFSRRRIEAQERIGGQKDEQQEGQADPGLHGQNIGLQRLGNIAAKDGDQSAEENEDQQP